VESFGKSLQRIGSKGYFQQRSTRQKRIVNGKGKERKGKERKRGKERMVYLQRRTNLESSACGFQL